MSLWGSSCRGFESSKGRSEPGRSPDIHLLDRAHNARRRRLSCGQPAGPKTVNAAESRLRLAESRLSGVRRDLVTAAAADVNRAARRLHSDESGRLFLGGLVATRARLRFTG